jgi:hypothetical protein
MMTLKEALDVMDTHHAGQLPIQTVDFASDLGIAVYRVPDWPNDLSGMIKRTEDTDSGFSIFVNAEHPVVRRRFTIAHECAHAMLHPELIGDGIVDDALYRSGLSSRIEAQANRLAADILMPRRRLNQLIDRGVTSASELAAAFWVSEQSMAIRLGVPQDV